MVAVVPNNSIVDSGNSRTGIISHFTNDQVACKLMAMGVLPGSHIALIRRGPWSGGWYAKVDNSFIAMRNQEAACIVMKK